MNAMISVSLAVPKWKLMCDHHYHHTCIVIVIELKFCGTFRKAMLLLMMKKYHGHEST